MKKVKFKWVTYPQKNKFENDHPDAKCVIFWHYDNISKVFCGGYTYEDHEIQENIQENIQMVDAQ